MSDPQLGSNQPTYQKPSGVPQSLPLVPLPTLPQGSASMTRLGGVSQGVRIPGRPLPNNGVTDNSMMAALLNQTNNHPNLVNSLSATNMRKRKLPNDDYVVLRRKVSENHYTRLKRLQVRYAEHVALLCFLQSNGHQGDYCSWRTRLPPVPLNNFLKSHKLNPNDEKEDLYTVLENFKTVLNSSSSPGKPAMVSSGVQNDRSPQGNSTSTPIPSRVPHPHLPYGRQPATSAQKNMVPSSHGTCEAGSGSGSTNQEQQIVEKAKQEAYVMQRVGELQKDGLWAEKRLPKVHELPRAKAHWDYLLEEMTWLAADFAQERKWKKAAAKKCARMVQKYFQEKEAMKQKAIKAQEMQLRRIASFIAREVKQFWGNVEKLVEFKQQTRLEEKRKKALDQHLSFIVDQTEKYSSLVAESMNTSAPSPKNKHLGHSDDEFEPDGPSEDDEETIAKEEAMSSSTKENVDDEINQLKRESELPIEDLLSDYLQQREQLDSFRHSEDDNGDDGDFQASGKESSDDEETIQEQEQAEGKVDYGRELKELEDEGNLNIEELKAKYGLASSAQQNAKKRPEIATIDLDSDDDSDEQESDEDEDMDVDEPEVEEASEFSEEEMESEEESEKDQGSALKSLLNDGISAELSKEDRDKEINDVAAIAQSLQPKGNTLSSTSVVTKVPFLLKHSLREYQHIGLDWLVTMYDRKLNGILADEMGLGKTIQTIALLAHLACEKGNWGPHLIVVPTSVMLNWEMEIKKWCPAFKILTYYGTQKERKLKRSGWTKPNAFHICVTSYKLVIQDHQSFRRKKWKYLILDEAQNIKNFKSQRWQLLLNFQTQRRLLLTGTPLQNDLMELWSLMHFLMPDVFESHREFKEWFSNPVTGMIEGSSEYNESIIKRLHKVLRPFLLRRLKAEVETQMPKKYEHVVMCRLSNRQRYLYDDFMSRAKTKETLATGNLLSVINVLMQLRKVCNHPNLFEVRPTVSPFQMEKIIYSVPSLVWNALNYDPFKNVDLGFLNLLLVEFELWLLAFVAHRAKRYKIPSDIITHIDSAPPEPPPCPKSKVRINLTKRNAPPPVQNQIVSNNLRQTIFQVGGTNRKILTPICTTKVGTSPLMKSIIGTNSNQGVTLKFSSANAGGLSQCLQLLQQPGGVKAISLASSGQVMKTGDGTRIVPQLAQLVNTPSGRQLVLSPPVISSQAGGTVVTAGGQRLVLQKAGNVTKLINPIVTQLSPVKPTMKVPPLNISTSITTTVVQHNSISSSLPASVSSSSSSNTSLTTASASATSSTTPTSSPSKNLRATPSKIKGEAPSSSLKDVPLQQLRRKRRQEKLALLARVNERRIQAMPIYGVDLVDSVSCKDQISEPDWRCSGYVNCRKSVKLNPRNHWEQTKALQEAIYAVEDRVVQLSEVFSRFVLCVPAVAAPLPTVHVAHPSPWKETLEAQRISMLEKHLKPKFNLLHPISSAMSTLFPDPRLIQYDCGKLQSLDRLLRQLKTDHHRVLIFTQMTRMLDVLEAFLNFHGHIYLRLDGTTKVDQRQVLMERFNADKRIFCFILSTRSGGVGINLTGADTVIFYDSDWNPTMDAQAQDRCHRIGQTRDVHIYRLISEKTVEENILKKANQKRMLGDLAIEGGNFTTAYFRTTTIEDIFNVDVSENDASRRMAEVLRKDNDIKEETPSLTSGEEKTSLGILENALAQAEDDSDVAAAKVAKAEAAAELAEFDENIPIDSQEPELSKAEQELNALMQQLSGVEKYAMNFVERSESVWSAERLAAAEAEIEMQKKEWEKGRMATVKEEDRKKRVEEAENDIITYSAADARNQIWMSNDAKDIMPIWGPPTPPQGEGDVYIDHSLGLLYEPKIIPTELLPPVYTKKEKKRTRIEAGLAEGRVPTKIRPRDDSLMHIAPRSLFDRPSPALIKMRQEMRYHRHRGTPRPITTLIKPTVPVKHPPEPDYIPDWTIQEDYTILQAIQNIQELTLNLIVLSPGHTPNWDLVADMVNHTSRTYRSPKQCKNRYESVIILREEGKLLFDNPKKKKKNNPPYKLPLQMKTSRPLKTAQLYGQDNNVTVTQIMNARFEAIRTISNRRAPTTKPLLVNPVMKNTKLSDSLSESLMDLETPLTPVEVASKRADRIAKEKAMSVRGIAVTPEQHIAAIRLQQQQLRAAAVKTTTITTSSVTSTVTLATSSTRPVAVQEIMASSVVRAVASSPTSQSVVTPPRGTVANVVSVQSSSTPLPKGTKTISPAQLQIYRQQHLFRQQQQLRVLQSRPPTQKVSVAVASSTPTARVQQVQVKASGLTRTVSESEMLALLKRQQVTKVSTNTTIASAQLLAQAQATLQAQQQQQAQQSGSSGVGQVTTLVKTVSATSLPVASLLPQVKAALGAGIKQGTVTPQQIRQLSIQQQLIGQQRKFPQQKVTQIGQVTTKGCGTAQLILQSQKPTTMTMQQIQQVMKQVPQHVVAQVSTGQVIPHSVFSKAQSSSQPRVIPVATSSQQPIKQAIQVVSASSVGATRAIPSVTIEASGRTAATIAGAMKSGTASQQAILTQVSAVLQQGQPIIRQPVRIQASSSPIVAVAVSQAPTLLTLPPQDNNQQQ